jgi:stage V sporulation protein B
MDTPKTQLKTKPVSGSFMKQAIILAAASLIVRFIGFLYRIPLTGLIGDEGNGIYASGYYIYTFLLVLSSAGLPAAISKMVSERVVQKKYEDAHNVFLVSFIFASTLGLICSLLLFFGAEFLANFVENPDSVYSIITLSPTVFIVAVMSVFRGYFQGLNTTVPTAVSQVIEQIFNAVFSVYIAYILLGNGIEFAAAGGTSGTGIGALAGLVFIFGCYLLARKGIVKRARAYTSKDREDRETKAKIAITLAKTAFPIILGTAIFSIANLADLKMVMNRLGASGSYTYEEAKILYGQLTGKYVVLTTLPIFVATSLSTAVVPNLASAMFSDKANIKRKIDLALRMTMIISIPAAIGMGVLGDQILTLLWPNNDKGGILLQVGSVAIIFLALAQISTGVLQGIGKVHIPAIAAFFGAMVKISLNHWLIPIPEINVIGAVISTIGCYVVACTIDFTALIKIAKITPDYLNIFFKPVTSSILMGISSYSAFHILRLFGAGHNPATLCAIFTAMVVYFLFMFFMGGIKRSDILMLPAGTRFLRTLEKVRLM